MNSKNILGILVSLLLPNCIFAQSLKGTMLTGKVQEEQFGRTVKISADGNTLAIAAPLNSETGDRNGRITMYKFDGYNWQMMGNEILPGAKDFRYGEMMELSEDGQKIIIASPFGGVSFYGFDGKGWTKSPQAIHLENQNDQIQSISITPDAGKMAVSFDCQKHRTVCIKLFNFDGKQWLQDGVDLIPYPDEKIYGLALSLSANGKLLVVGNYSKDTKELKNAGEVIFYSKEGNQWKRNNKSFFGDAANAHLGSAVAVAKNGNLTIAAANSIDLNRNTGFVETYKMNDNTWVKQTDPLKPEKQNSYFGHSISISADGNTMALSMPYLAYGKPGYVKVYRNKSLGWQEIAMITDADGVEKTSPANNTVGWSIALSSDGKTLVIGFPHNDENGDMSGKVIVYDLTNLK